MARALDNARRQFPTLNYSTSTVEACAGADVVLLATEWDEFRTLQPGDLDAVVRSPAIVDGRNCLDGEVWRRAGWRYQALGRGCLR